MMNVSRETSEKLAIYAGLIRKWTPSINLIARATVDSLETRHFLDCEQVVSLSQNARGSWVDLGSGGGLPGLIMAIHRPDLQCTLVEIDQRKSVFLRTVIREAGLTNAKIVTERIEEITPLSADHISARALAPMAQLMPYVHQHLSQNGTAWLMKGRNWRKEVELALETWSFDCKSHPSTTDPEAAILEITRIQHV